MMRLVDGRAWCRQVIVRDAVVLLTDAIDQARLVVVDAPAGYGKTVALDQWCAILQSNGRPVARFKATGRDADEHMLSMLHLRPDPDVRRVVAIDDAHLLSPGIVAAIDENLAEAPDGMTVILAGRLRPALRVGRLRAQGMLVEIGTEELKVRDEEIGAFLRARGASEKDMAVLLPLTATLDGWAAGLALLPMSGGDARSFARHVDEYVEEELLGRLPFDLRASVEATAILREVSPATITGLIDDCDLDVLAAHIQDAGIPVRHVRGIGFHYPPFMREALGRRLRNRDEARYCDLHRQAALREQARGSYMSAALHAGDAGDMTLLGALLEAGTEQFNNDGQMDQTVTLARKLPPDILAGCPGVQLTLAWHAARRLDFDVAERLIQGAEAFARDLDDSEETLRLLRIVRHRYLVLAIARDDLATVERESQALMVDFWEDDPLTACSMLAPLISAQRELYHIHDMTKLQVDARDALARCTQSFPIIAGKSAIAPTLIAYGCVAAGIEILEEAMALAEAVGGSGSGIGALPAIRLAEIAYETGDRQRARDLLDRYSDVLTDWQFVDQMLSGHLLRARLFEADGDVQAALRELERTGVMASRAHLPRLHAGILNEQVRLLLLEGQVEDARRLLHASKLVPEGSPVPTRTPSRREEPIALAWIRMSIADGRLREAETVAGKWRDFLNARGSFQSLLRFELLIAQSRSLAGAQMAAVRALRSAVATAARGGWVRPFAEEGPVIVGLVAEAFRGAREVSRTLDQFVPRLLGELDISVPSAKAEGVDSLTEALVGRELEIVMMASQGMKNREIGTCLGLSENTVKWYMQQIYSKLGVHSRLGAVQCSRRMGLLND